MQPTIWWELELAWKPNLHNMEDLEASLRLRHATLDHTALVRKIESEPLSTTPPPTQEMMQMAIEDVVEHYEGEGMSMRSRDIEGGVQVDNWASVSGKSFDYFCIWWI